MCPIHDFPSQIKLFSHDKQKIVKSLKISLASIDKEHHFKVTSS